MLFKLKIMFNGVDIINYINILKSDSLKQKYLLIDKYKDIYQLILNYCLKNEDIILSDLDILIDKDISKNLCYNLYSPYPFKHATLLSNEISKITKLVEMRTLISHKEFSININLIQMINFYALPYIKIANKNIKFINTIILPIDKSINKELINLQFLSPEIELINVYNKLYNPVYVDEWEKLLKLEKKLYIIYKHIFIIKNINLKHYVDKSLINLKQYIVNNWCFLDKIIIGYWGYILYVKDDNSHNFEDINIFNLKNERLQIISQNSIENDILTLETLVKKKSSFQISYKQQNINIPKDFRIKKYIISIVKNGNSIIIMEIYNSSSFELIPYIDITYLNFKYRVGNPFVLLRFFLIDYWLLRYINALSKISTIIYENKLNNIMKCIKFIRSKIDLGFGIKYTGQYIDEIIADKLRKLSTKRHIPYLPYVKMRTF